MRIKFSFGFNWKLFFVFQIYEKICDLTGESKNAHRLVKKPIKFNETRIPQFNKTLQAFINRTKEFPDYYDVLRMLEHCNRTFNLGLVNFEMKNIGEVILQTTINFFKSNPIKFL